MGSAHKQDLKSREAVLHYFHATCKAAVAAFCCEGAKARSRGEDNPRGVINGES